MDLSLHSDQTTHSHSSHTDPSHPQSARYGLPGSASSRPYTGPPQALRPPPSIYHQRRQSMQLDNTQYSPDTCISSLLPPGVDPASVDFRTFYPYIPNEVKHRKRTSRAQLKVLEDVFRKDTKPNAALRKKLAKQLDMTARGVQVWFQNRRAKEKTQAKKALTASKTAPIPNLSNNCASPKLESPPLSPELDSVHELPASRHNSLDKNVVEAINTSSPVASFLGRDRSWSNSSGQSPEDTTASSGDFHTNTHLHALRRGSLPTISQPSDRSALGPPMRPPDLSRRRSVDTSLSRLASHPYAQVAMAKNGAIYGGAFQRYPPQLRTPSSAGQAYSNSSPHARTPVGTPHRPSLAHRASLPGDRGLPSPRHHGSYDQRGYRFSTPGIVIETPSAPLPSLLPSHTTRARFPDSHLFSIPARTVSSPIPGPLPSPNFSFGAPSPIASPSPTGTDGDSPGALSSLPAYLFSRRPEDQDAEDDGTSASYSRFGSIASLAGSESSSTSAYYSEVGSAGFDPEVRRGSCSAPGQIMELMSGLDVNGQPSPVAQDTYAPQEGQSMTGMADSTGRDNRCRTETYPSPSSTVSPGHSPHVHEAVPPALPISRSSELAFALQTNDGQSSASPNDIHYRKPSDSPAADATPLGFGENVSQYVYGEVSHQESSIYTLSAANASSNSSLGLPTIDYPDKYRYDGDTMTYSATGHYDPLSAYPTPASGHFETNFATGEGHHVSGFGPSSEVYPTYNADPCNNPSSIENPLESVVQYS